MESNTSYTWLKDRIMVLPIEAGESVEMNVDGITTRLQASEKGILLPETVAQQEFSNSYVKGKVMKIGSAVTECKVGDTVLVYGGRYDGDIKLNGILYYIVREGSIAGVLDISPVAKKKSILTTTLN